MQESLKSLINHPLFSLGSLTLAILGIILAFVFYLRSKKDKIPCFEKSSNTIIEGLHKSLDGLQVHYNNQFQERVTVTKIIFWNAGKETINKIDLVELDQLRVLTPSDVDILDIKILDISTSSNSVEIDEVPANENIYPVSFNYLDHEDYFIIQIIHNGSSKEKFDIQGKIKGVKKLNRTIHLNTKSNIKTYNFLSLFPIYPNIESIIGNAFFMKYVGSFIYLVLGFAAIWNIITDNNVWYLWLAAIFCLVVSVTLFLAHRHLPPKKI
jgi:hypothetical protein